MTIQQLYYFKTVAELQHYTKAAEDLNITQPSLSYAIREMEKELGCRLFYKSGRNIKLTKCGTVYLERVNAALDELQQGKEEIQAIVNPKGGNIVIVQPSAVSVAYMPLLIEKFFRSEDGNMIKVSFVETPTEQVIAALKEGRADVGFGSYFKDDSLYYHPVYWEPLAAIVGTKHELANEEEITISQLAQYPFIHYEKSCGIRGLIDDLMRSNEVSPKVVCEAIDNVIVTQIVSSHLGVAIVPERFANPFYKVHRLRIKNEDPQLMFYMIWPKNKKITSATRRFIEFVKGLDYNETTQEMEERGMLY